MSETYTGAEQRKGYCPVHHIKCDEWKETKAQLKNKVPIWVFTTIITIGMAVVGYMSFSMRAESTRMLAAVTAHTNESVIYRESINRMLRSLAHGQSEIAVNQRNVMEKLELDFTELPEYGFD